MISKETKEVIHKLLCLFVPHKKPLVAISFLLFIVAMVSLSLPLLNRRLIDDGILAKDFNVVITVIAFIVGLLLLKSIVEIIQEIIRAKILKLIQQKLYHDAFSALFKVKISYFHSKNTVEIQDNIERDIMRIGVVCDSEFMLVLTQILSFLGGLIGLCIIDYRLTILVLLFFPIKLLTVYFIGKKRQEIINIMLTTYSALAQWIGDNLEAIKEIRLFGIKQHKFDEASAKVDIVTNSEKKIAILDCYNFVSDFLIIQLLEAVLYVVGAYFIFSGSLSVGSLFAFITYSMTVMTPLSTIINYVLAGILPSSRRYFNFLKETDENHEHDGIADILDIETIEFRNVSVSYAQNKILNNVSFKVEKGDHIAIIGSNGSGKSTIFNLIQRFIDSNSGEILINDVPISHYKLKDYRNLLSCINQHNRLFDLSIIENITLYKKMNKKEFDEIVELCELKTLLSTCQEAVGVNGQTLSGGQKQKVILARMLAHPADVYLLDEASTSFDNATEELLSNIVENKLKEKIVISIIHDKSKLNQFQKIIELDGCGGIIGFNTVDYLKHNN